MPDIAAADSVRAEGQRGEGKGPASSRFSRVVKGALAIWLGMFLAIGSSLMARHLVALPKPDLRVQTAEALSGLRQPGERGGWFAVHVLYAGCRCSARVLEHLTDKTRVREMPEVVLWIGSEPEAERKLAAAGLRVVATDSEIVNRRYGIEAAPMLAVLDRDDHVAYLGGYSDRKQALDVQDRRILTALRGGEHPSELPVFGCAVSDRLRASVNPLGLP